jgi:hypothetical protein
MAELVPHDSQSLSKTGSGQSPNGESPLNADDDSSADAESQPKTDDDESGEALAETGHDQFADQADVLRLSADIEHAVLRIPPPPRSWQGNRFLASPDPSVPEAGESSCPAGPWATLKGDLQQLLEENQRLRTQFQADTASLNEQREAIAKQGRGLVEMGVALANTDSDLEEVHDDLDAIQRQLTGESDSASPRRSPRRMLPKMLLVSANPLPESEYESS